MLNNSPLVNALLIVYTVELTHTESSTPLYQLKGIYLYTQLLAHLKAVFMYVYCS